MSAPTLCTLLCRGHFELFQKALPGWKEGLRPREIRVHDDGSLTAEQQAWILGEGLTLFPYAAATAKIFPVIAPFRHLLRWRESSYKPTLKLVDIILLNQDQPSILYLDADIFILGPCELPPLPAEVKVVGMRDAGNYYRLGFWPDTVARIPEAFNSGILYFHPNAIDLKPFDDFLGRLDASPFQEGMPWVVEQTCWAASVGADNGRIFSPDLVVVPESDTIGGSAIWHLAGLARNKGIAPPAYDATRPGAVLEIVPLPAWISLDAWLPRQKWRIALNRLREKITGKTLT